MINGLDILSLTLPRHAHYTNWSPYWLLENIMLVRYCPVSHNSCSTSSFQDNDPEISMAFDQENSLAKDWIMANERLIAINTAILSLIHPQQYALGMSFLRAALENPAMVADNPFFQTMLYAWVSPMTGFVLHSNCPIQSQPAFNGKSEWYEILMACGYYKGEDFFLPEINLRLRCTQRTAIGMCSHIFQHHVGKVTTGNRMIFKWYMRHGLWEELNIPHHTTLPILHSFPNS